MPNASFLAIDESECAETGLLSMTGVFIPLSSYAAIRSRYYEFARQLRGDPANLPIVRPLEMHGRELLRNEKWATDDHRIACFQFVVGIINEFQLMVKRCAYELASLNRHPFDEKSMRFSMCFSGLMWMGEAEFEQGLIVPVFDGLNMKVANWVRLNTSSTQSLAGTGKADWCSIKNSHNLCETVFASSQMSILIQLTDMVSYMLHVRDYRNRDLPMSEFKCRIFEESCRLNEDLVTNSITAAKLNGV